MEAKDGSGQAQYFYAESRNNRNEFCFKSRVVAGYHEIFSDLRGGLHPVVPVHMHCPASCNLLSCCKAGKIVLRRRRMTRSDRNDKELRIANNILPVSMGSENCEEARFAQ